MYKQTPMFFDSSQLCICGCSMPVSRRHSAAALGLTGAGGGAGTGAGRAVSCCSCRLCAGGQHVPPADSGRGPVGPVGRGCIPAGPAANGRTWAAAGQVYTDRHRTGRLQTAPAHCRPPEAGTYRHMQTAWAVNSRLCHIRNNQGPRCIRLSLIHP